MESEYCRLPGNQSRARGFLHWKPDRFEVPRYNGVDVTTPDGLRTVLADAGKVIDAIDKAIESSPQTRTDDQD